MVGLLDFEAAITEDLVESEPFGGKSSKKGSRNVLQGRKQDIIGYLVLLLAERFLPS